MATGNTPASSPTAAARAAALAAATPGPPPRPRAHLPAARALTVAPLPGLPANRAQQGPDRRTPSHQRSQHLIKLQLQLSTVPGRRRSSTAGRISSLKLLL